MDQSKTPTGSSLRENLESCFFFFVWLPPPFFFLQVELGWNQELSTCKTRAQSLSHNLVSRIFLPLVKLGIKDSFLLNKSKLLNLLNLVFTKYEGAHQRYFGTGEHYDIGAWPDSSLGPRLRSALGSLPWTGPLYMSTASGNHAVSILPVLFLFVCF